MEGLLIYFSGTGNSKFIAECIKKEFNKRGHNITLYSIENNLPINWDCYEFFIFGSPKYYEYTPLFFINWIKKNVPRLSRHSKCILFCTGSAAIATSFKSLNKILKKKNLHVVITKTFQMPSNYLIGFFNPTDEEKYDIYSKWSFEKAGLMVQDFLDNIYSIEKINPIIGFMCEKVSYYFCKSTKYKSKNFSISPNCTKCTQCIRHCPTHNIQLIDDKIVFKNNCILCTRCINFCPENAIIYKNKKTDQYTHNLKELNLR
ncbi:EFR1 family ferrodoxin [Clostridium sp. MB40-C1]|uniref:EFR1 family ferrodoxin n=1 Tax=Clostridium sp. MB40-C1 TaxID=3070996 RepID=UPI0027DF9CB9|nr:EFR1 family ferrodoxin [Clostridium sp. MB40-C1]WMJ80103.1 EFR1 family ferrodoxin [Clostridium sp. MB40-C1]